MADYVRYDATQIKQWLNGVFEKLGVPARDAQMTTNALIPADLMGIDSHGLNRVTNQLYAGGLKDGVIDPKASPEVVHQSQSTATVGLIDRRAEREVG